MAETPERPELARRLGFAEATAVALGAMIGAGVYVSIGEAADATGGSLLAAVLVGAGVATLNGLSAAELGADDPHAGGANRFGRRLVSPDVVYRAGWLLLLAELTAGATFALTFAAYLGPLLPGLPPRHIGLALLLVALLLNLLGVRISARANLLLVTVSIGVLIVFVALTLPAFSVGRLQPFLAAGLLGLLRASALMFFAYTGYARPVTVAEEVQEPASTLPRAVLTALAVTTLLYSLVALSALGALGPERMGQEEAPLRAALLEAGHPLGSTLISLGALVATSTVLITGIWGLSRLAFAMAREGDLPEWFGRLAEPEGIPRNAVLAGSVVLILLAAFLDLRPALEASSLALLAYYGIMNLSALRLPPDRRLYPSVVPAAGLVGCTLLALSLPWQTLAAVLGTLVAGLAYYALRHGRRW